MALNHILISGKVQGVGFRRFVQKRAKQNRVRGWVRNLRDGRVEALFDSTGGDYEAFMFWVRKGPPGSRVDRLEESTKQGKIDYDSFEVTADGETAYV